MNGSALVRMLTLEVAASNWFARMSPRERKAYVRAHPRSKYARDGNAILAHQAGRLAARSGDLAARHDGRSRNLADRGRERPSAHHRRVGDLRQQASDHFEEAQRHFTKGRHGEGQAALTKGHRVTERADRLHGAYRIALREARDARRATARPRGASGGANKTVPNGKKPVAPPRTRKGPTEPGRVQARAVVKKAAAAPPVAARRVARPRKTGAAPAPGPAVVDNDGEGSRALRMAKSARSRAREHDEKRGVRHAAGDADGATHHERMSHLWNASAEQFDRSAEHHAAGRTDKGNRHMSEGRRRARALVATSDPAPAPPRSTARELHDGTDARRTSEDVARHFGGKNYSHHPNANRHEHRHVLDESHAQQLHRHMMKHGWSHRSQEIRDTPTSSSRGTIHRYQHPNGGSVAIQHRLDRPGQYHVHV